MSITVSNTRPDTPRVTLFGQLDNGTYVAEVMEETSVPYTRRWANAIDQAMVYIDPDNAQLERMIAALNEGKLDFGELQNYGSSGGGTSTLPI